MERNIGYEADPDAFRREWLPKEEEISRQIEAARKIVGNVTYTKRDMLSIAALTASLNVDGHRADLIILKAARAQAALEGRTSIKDHDIALAAELALPHRIKRGPFHQAEVNAEQLQERIEQLVGQTGESTPSDEPAPQDGQQQEKKSRS
jgi:Mg-chelatase subunit ChlI